MSFRVCCGLFYFGIPCDIWRSWGPSQRRRTHLGSCLVGSSRSSGVVLDWRRSLGLFSICCRLRAFFVLLGFWHEWGYDKWWVFLSQIVLFLLSLHLCLSVSSIFVYCLRSFWVSLFLLLSWFWFCLSLLLGIFGLREQIKVVIYSKSEKSLFCCFLLGLEDR